MGIRKSDIVDADIIDSAELISDGYSVYLTTTVVSTTSGTKIVVINLPADGEGILRSFDHPAAGNDRVHLTGTSGGSGNGYFTINTVLSDTSFNVLESIGTSAGGSVDFIYAPGASQVGFDATGLSATSSHTVEAAIVDLATSIGSGSINYDFLLDNEPPRPNTTYTNTVVGGSVTQELWTNTATAFKFKTVDYSYTGTLVTTEVRKIWDSTGTIVVAQMTINYTYSGSSVTSETITRDI